MPHTDPRQAAEFVLQHLPELPAVPTLPRRSPHEGMLAQSFVGVRGVSVDDDGELVIDPRRLDPMAQIVPDLGHPAFAGLQAFLDAAQGRTGPVKWQLTGPVTLGLALTRQGLSPNRAFDVGIRASRVLLRAVHREITKRLPGCDQVVFLDEPGMSALLRPGFPIPPDAAIDLVSGSLAAVEATTMAGIHCCGDGDWAAVLATGPAVLSMPVSSDLSKVAGYLARFLEADGWIAWGAVPTDRPVASNADRYWRELSAVWCELVQGGCDAGRLRRQSMVTPACGLAMHSPEQAGKVLALTRAVAERVAGQAVATQLSLGA
ncbi:MAG TPA: hypothetical protein VF855_07230 [Acidimicrobiales bacterium]